ncbi:3-keto-5-aminohexanoate cleavage protein (plasmid) [Cupriavidus pinatubonensis]|uniref:3-keto-5-aminohexanoate cleavage protein n=1 Tax=Cupriavidus pinatubonensis TaxID=248026 RepID=UPI001C733881|nr:3-keto-5-aminohexanoate cleavage protein [Cupriavidus pinatubonensis]QYY33868.1 3-keto-5-aminohexanoate cleavage protein [Cupriavidus pinatubonensis]
MRAQKKLIIEARINEYMPRSENPNIPYTPEEIGREAAKAREAGASIIHFHARQADGKPAHDAETFEACIRAIRANCDCLVFPTLGQISNEGEMSRLAHIEVLSKSPETQPDLAPIDCGSTNIDRFDYEASRYMTGHLTYKNDTKILEAFARRLPELGVKPQFVSWTVAFTRCFSALRDMGLVKDTPYFMFELTDCGILGGHPGTIQGLYSHLPFLPKAPLEWTVCNKIGNPTGPAVAAIELGGHIALGLGDYGWSELGTPNNGDVINHFAKIAKMMGREVATPDETRAMFGMA